MSLENTHNSTRSSYIHFVQNKRLNHAFYHLISFIKFNLPGCFFIMENRFLSFRHLFLLPARGWNFFDSQAILKIRNKKSILIVTEPQGWSYRAPIICRPGARKRVVWKWGPLKGNIGFLPPSQIRAHNKSLPCVAAPKGGKEAWEEEGNEYNTIRMIKRDKKNNVKTD